MSVIVRPFNRYVPYSRLNRHYLHSDPLEGMFEDIMPWYGQDSYLRPAGYTYKPRHVTVCPRRPTLTRRMAPWVSVVNLPGFEPSDIDVKEDGANVVVHARRQIQQGDDYDVMEARRFVHVPDGVDKDAVRCNLRPNGDLVFTAPYVKETNETQANKDIKHKQQTASTPWIVSDLISTFLTGLAGNSDKQTAIKRKCEENNKDCNASRPLKKRIPVKMGGDKATAEKAVEQRFASTAEEPKTKDNEENLQITTTKSVVSDKVSVERVDVDEEVQRLTERTETPTEASRTEFRLSSDVSVENSPCCKPPLAADAEEEKVESEASKPDAATEGPQNSVINADVTELKSCENNTKLVEENGKKVFQVELDLSDFKPENISVKTDGRMLYIDGESHLEKDGICILQEIHRTYTLPEGALANVSKATMTERGSFRVTVPMCVGMADVPVQTLPQCA